MSSIMSKFLSFFSKIKTSIKNKNIYPTLKIDFNAKVDVQGLLIAGEEISIGRFSNIIIAKNSQVVLGNNIWINDNCHIETMPGQSIYIGSGTTLQSRCQIRGDVKIGQMVLMAPNVFISSGMHMYNYMPELYIREQDQKYLDDNGQYYSNPIEVGNDCWLGINTVITPGVSINDGCVVGANAVVTKNMPKNVIIGGVPATIIKKRF
jgi:acetyltransferase-like isoleucine patch superfamily enzyme